MTRSRFAELTALQGRQVSLALHNGDRIDDAKVKHLVDIDEDALAAAQAELGTVTM